MTWMLQRTRCNADPEDVVPAVCGERQHPWDRSDQRRRQNPDHIKKTNNLLIFTLQDNGIGMSEEVKNRLMSYLYGDEQIGDRIGVQNVIYRLRLYYADRFKFDIQSKQGQGTRIHIEIPIE